jgi:epoxyqueuosine reductase
MSLSDEIVDFGLNLGYHSVGFASVEPFGQISESLEGRIEEFASFEYLRNFADPLNMLPEGKSLVVAIYDFFKEGFPEELVGKVGRFYQARCYLPLESRLEGARAALMREFMESKGITVGPWPRRRNNLADRQAAARAGLGQFGKNNFICVPELGTFVLLSTWIVDVELEYGTPQEDLHCPPNCTLCLEACPTGALTENRLNPQRCIAFNNFRTRGEDVTGISQIIPKEIRPKLGTWIHGCDLCQEVCPKNMRKLRANLPVNRFLEKKAREFDLIKMLHMTDEYYAQVVEPLMYNYIREMEVFRRNAAIALGNIGDPEAVPALSDALDDPSEAVRAHAAWALGRIGGHAAKGALEKRRSTENGSIARQEIEDALAEIVV